MKRVVIEKFLSETTGEISAYYSATEIRMKLLEALRAAMASREGVKVCSFDRKLEPLPEDVSGKIIAFRIFRDLIATEAWQETNGAERPSPVCLKLFATVKDTEGDTWKILDSIMNLNKQKGFAAVSFRECRYDYDPIIGGFILAEFEILPSRINNLDMLTQIKHDINVRVNTLS